MGDFPMSANVKMGNIIRQMGLIYRSRSFEISEICVICVARRSPAFRGGASKYFVLYAERSEVPLLRAGCLFAAICRKNVLPVFQN